jgi:hypothetical protein
MQYGMIGYYVPLERYPNTHNGQALAVAALASQKRHLWLYLMGIYADEDAGSSFRERWESTGKKLDMGKSCVRFRRVEDVPLDVIAEAVRRRETPPERGFCKAAGLGFEPGLPVQSREAHGV